MQELTDLGQLHPSSPLNVQEIRAVIFDVDGTLYDLKKMYARVRLDVMKYYLFRLGNLRDIQLITTFIRERERHAHDQVVDLEQAQYEWAATAAGVSVEKVRDVVQQWVVQAPLNYIYSCRRIEVVELFAALAQGGMATGVFSDYPSQAKLVKLGLSPRCMISATDRQVGRLKPDPTGLLVVAATLGVAVEQCLFIGDRDDRDGECARRAGMPYLILGQGKHLLPVSATVLAERLLSNLTCSDIQLECPQRGHAN